MAALIRHPSLEGGGVYKRQPLPNNPKQPHVTKYDICVTHSSTLVLDDLTACLQFTIDANHNERRKDISFSFTGIYSTTGGDVGVIAPSLAEEEVAKMTHYPKLPTDIHL